MRRNLAVLAGIAVIATVCSILVARWIKVATRPTPPPLGEIKEVRFRPSMAAGKPGLQVEFDAATRQLLIVALERDLKSVDCRTADFETSWGEFWVELSDGTAARLFNVLSDTLYEPQTKIAWRATESGPLLQSWFRRWRLDQWNSQPH
jgi:hypothetical protein